MIILCIIPARSGSKGILNKNIKLLNGKPLIYYSIKQALECKYKMKIIVSTDSQEYADIAIKYGAEVPILRPKELAEDNSTDFDFINHMVNYLKENDDYYPDIILQLRPTQPLRKVLDINKCLDLFIQKYDDYDSLRTVIENDKTPYKMYSIQNNNLKPLLKLSNVKEPFNLGRQFLPKTYLHNGYIDILKTTLLEKKCISGTKILPYIMDKNDTYDIDTPQDWEKVKNILQYNI